MLVVLAHPRDEQARGLVVRWASEGARLLSLLDLSTPGWQHRVGGTGPELAVVGGEQVEVSTFRGVVTRLPGYLDSDLTHIAPEDRSYVASELNAFLASWLSRLPCPVLNRPTASSLMGPSLGLERWLSLAARCGLPLAAARRDLGDGSPRRVASVTVVGRRWLGEVDAAVGEQAVRLAMAAGVELLTARFEGPAFVSAELSIDVGAPAVAEVLLERFGSEARA
ncbi:hypothetical protein [Myxococcus sp. RHSTA-1-4]|uniref:hypothetical protein n=1 Tax=Myxococcus sp. RHSTA-1-4 TaxID=2874601 RepID=UPI001CBB774B|nr:hypothetical protein [Myxococcus sp. RHSTA-1-4]MBZ4422796.1 hypothetical protein [Myxococcus sp. RHSTA-1-4]